MALTACIYLRTSTREQHPENQLEDCLTFAESRGYDVPEKYIFIEQVSAYRDPDKRTKYKKVKELAHEGKIKAVVCWSISRWVRNRENLIRDINFLTYRGCNLHSVKESWLEDVNIKGPIGDALQTFLIGLVGALAELESIQRSERVFAAMDTDEQGRKVAKRSRKHWGANSRMTKGEAIQAAKLWISRGYIHGQREGLRTVAERVSDEIGKKISFVTMAKIRDGAAPYDFLNPYLNGINKV